MEQTAHWMKLKATKHWEWKFWNSGAYIVGEWGGEWGKQVGNMDEESQVRGCYNITFICTNQETV